jgi:hypothetical protein
VLLGLTFLFQLMAQYLLSFCCIGNQHVTRLGEILPFGLLFTSPIFHLNKQFLCLRYFKVSNVI